MNEDDLDELFASIEIAMEHGIPFETVEDLKERVLDYCQRLAEFIMRDDALSGLSPKARIEVSSRTLKAMTKVVEGIEGDR
jgi:hypothetical protein